MKKFEKIFKQHINKKVQNDLKFIDKICIKLNVDVQEALKFHLNCIKTSDCSLVGDVLETFRWFLSEKIDKLLEKNEIKMVDFFFESDVEGFYIKEWKEFKKKIIKSDFNLRKILMEDKIFAYTIKDCGVKIFSKSELRQLKLEKLNENG